MTNGRRLTDEQLDEMAELREQGWTTSRIKRHFERQGVALSQGVIDWQCLRLGADLPPHLRRPPAQLERPYRRGGKLVRPFTVDDDRRLIELEATGKRISEIAKELGRPGNSIRGRLYTLARREARAEELAQ